jgi:hypothetical protein
MTLPAPTADRNGLIAGSSGTAADGGWQRWWAIEARRNGSDWAGIATLHIEVLQRLRRAYEAAARTSIAISSSST